MESPQVVVEKWRRRAEALGLTPEPERLEALAPPLEELEQRLRPAFDRDLARVEPDFRFQP